ncbi:alpha/beta hydrolase [Pseudomonas sp. B22129]|uniref:alpha/beta hydrolase n=1 Tax=Pseudomonas sp. B22129 TaxID=3235111 RepID=UPI0037840E93
MTSSSPLPQLHTDHGTGLHYRRRPAHATPRARLVLLHGVGGNETNLAGLINDLPADIELLFVRGPLPMGPQRYAWFQVSFIGEGPRINEPQAEASRQSLIQFVQNQAPLPTLIAGFSQGGIMSASVALSAPQAVAGFGLLSGRILPELKPAIAARDELEHLCAFVAHGRNDEKLPVFWAERSREMLNALGVPCRYQVYDMAHEMAEEEIADFVGWVENTLSASSRASS